MRFPDAEALGDAIFARPASGVNVVHVPFGTSKVDTLARLARRFTDLDETLIPIRVRPPYGGLDAGSVGLAQIADGLFGRMELPEERASLINPSINWSAKVDVIRDCIHRFSSRTILLCDEPHDWSGPLLESNRNSGHARDLASLVLDGVSCRRVVTSKRPSALAISNVLSLDKPDERPLSPEWGMLDSSASAIAEGMDRHKRAYSRAEVGLLVALAHVSSFAASRRFLVEVQPPKVLGQAVVNAIASSAGYAGLLSLWRTVSLLRRPCDAEFMREIDSGNRVLVTTPDAFDLLTRCLLSPITDGYEFPSILRRLAHEGFDQQEFRRSHAVIARVQRARYEVAGSKAALSDCMEAFHHASESGDAPLFANLQPFFVDQLDARGRAFSLQRRYKEAVEVFRQAITWDGDDDYGHHYLAYNLDVEGRCPTEVELHYRRAIELDRSNAWWWSRFITFLIVRGRTPDARQAWGEALQELSSQGDTDDFLYEHLHMWVARILLHRMRLDFAQQVLDDVPDRLCNDHPGFRALRRLLLHLEAARNQRDIQPLAFDIGGNGDEPLLSAKYDYGELLVRWLPGRVDEVTEDGVELTVAASEVLAPGEQLVRRLTMPRTEFDALSRDVGSDRLQAGAFVELAFYGQAKKPVIRVRPARSWRDNDLPPVFPRSDRYLRPATNRDE